MFSIIAPGLAPERTRETAVEDLLGPLNKLVSENRQRLDVTVLNERLGRLTCWRIVEESAAVHALVASLEDCVTQNIFRIVVRVLPDQRNGHLILVLEGLRHDGSTIAAPETSLGRPTAEIGFGKGCRSSHFG
jgi:hypothetical protein